MTLWEEGADAVVSRLREPCQSAFPLASQKRPEWEDDDKKKRKRWLCFNRKKANKKIRGTDKPSS